MKTKPVVFITGAGKGIGLATAKKFGANGYNVAFNDYDELAGQNASMQLKAEGIDNLFLAGDATDEKIIEDLINQAALKFGGLDCLVNNVGGLGGRNPIETMPGDFWHKVLTLNLHSKFYATRAALPHMKKDGGSIINLTSIAAYAGGGPGASAYATATAAVLTFTRAAAKEFIAHNIRVNAVAPGTIDTDFHSATARDIIDSWKAAIPAKRLGSPEEVANVIYFLSSPEASYLVGEVIQVNGGQLFL